jgi:hypothetical protein
MREIEIFQACRLRQLFACIKKPYLEQLSCRSVCLIIIACTGCELSGRQMQDCTHGFFSDHLLALIHRSYPDALSSPFNRCIAYYHSFLYHDLEVRSYELHVLLMPFVFHSFIHSFVHSFIHCMCCMISAN